MEVNKLIQDLQTNKDYTAHINTMEHQMQNTECGMYSLYFIISMLNEKLDRKKMTRKDLFEKLQHVRISDKKMKNLRKKYFNK